MTAENYLVLMMDYGNPFYVIHAHFGLVNFPLHFSIFVQNWHFYASQRTMNNTFPGRAGWGWNKWQSKLVHLPFYTRSLSALFNSTQLSVSSDSTLILSVCLEVVNNQSWQVSSDNTTDCWVWVEWHLTGHERKNLGFTFIQSLDTLHHLYVLNSFYSWAWCLPNIYLHM